MRWPSHFPWGFLSLKTGLYVDMFQIVQLDHTVAEVLVIPGFLNSSQHAGSKAGGHCGPCGPMPFIQAKSGATCQLNVVSHCFMLCFFNQYIYKLNEINCWNLGYGFEPPNYSFMFVYPNWTRRNKICSAEILIGMGIDTTLFF